MTSGIGLNDNLLPKEKKKYPKFYYILIFLFIYISDDTLLFGTNIEKSFIDAKYIFIMVAAVALTLYNFLHQRALNGRTFYFLISLVLLIMISMVVNHDVRLGYFYKICLLLYAFAIIQIMNFREFAEVFNRVVYLLAFASLIGFAIMIIMPSILSFLPILTNSKPLRFYNAGLTTIPIFYIGTSNLPRNFGIFREPGVYQMYLIMALLFQMFIIKENTLKRYLVYALAVLTTFSTTGFIALGIVFIMFLLNNNGLSKGKNSFLIILCVIVIISLLAFTDIFSTDLEDRNSGSIFYKIFNPTKSFSGAARFASVTENIRMFFEKPFFGVGLTALGEKFSVYAFQTYGIATPHNTNTLLIQFAAHGFIYGFLWIFGYWRLAKNIDFKNRLLIFIAIVVLYIGENLTFSGFANLFLLYGICETSEVFEENTSFMV